MDKEKVKEILETVGMFIVIVMLIGAAYVLFIITGD